MIDPVRAFVQTGGIETPYVRAGRGRVALLLRSRTAAAGEGPGGEEDPVFRSLAAGFRVIAPLVPPPAGRGSGERWLRGIIDGLGLDRPAVVADPELAPLLLRFAFRDRSRIGAVVILAEGGEGAAKAGTAAALLGSLPPVGSGGPGVP